MRYFIKEFNGINNWRGFLRLEDEDITEKVILAGTVYVSKEDMDDIELYNIEDEDSSYSISTEDAKEYEYLYVLKDEVFTEEEEYYLEHGWFEEDYTENEEREKIKEIIRKFKENCEPVIENGISNLCSYKACDYCDGHNWQEIILEHEYLDSEWTEITDELEDTKEIDYEGYNTGNYTLYKKEYDENCILLNSSFYEGSFDEIYFINEGVDNIDEALEYIDEKECDY